MPNNLALLHDSKDAASLYSDSWNTSTNQDLAFVSNDSDSCVPDRRVLEKLPRSQHPPSLITPPRFARSVPSKPVKRWNFRKVKRSHYIALTNKLARTLQPPDMDQCFCNAISTAAKKFIPCGRQNNCIQCWDAECKNLNQTFLRYPERHESTRAATALFAKKRRDRWSEAVQHIDSSHSSRVPWSKLNNLTGRSRQSPRQCPISANAIG